MALIQIIVIAYAIVASCEASGFGHVVPAVRSFPIVRHAPFYNFPSPVRSIHAISPAFPPVAPPFLHTAPVLPAPAPLFAPAARFAPAVATPVFGRSFPVPAASVVAPAPTLPAVAPAFRAFGPAVPSFAADYPGYGPAFAANPAPLSAYPAPVPAFPAVAPAPLEVPAPFAVPAGLSPAHIAYARAFGGLAPAPPAAVLPAPPLVRQFAWKK